MKNFLINISKIYFLGNGVHSARIKSVIVAPFHDSKWWGLVHRFLLRYIFSKSVCILNVEKVGGTCPFGPHQKWLHWSYLICTDSFITEKVIPENVFPTGNLVSVSTEEIFGCAYNLYTFSMKKFYIWSLHWFSLKYVLHSCIIYQDFFRETTSVVRQSIHPEILN